MTRRLFAALSVVLVGAAGLLAAADQQQFRSGIEAVTVNVAVREGDRPVTGLAADDFRLVDNGVRQSVEAVAIEAVPVDVTVFHDTSPSQGGRLEDLRADIGRIASMLRPADRFRLLTFGQDRQVTDVFGWREAGGDLDLSRVAVGPVSPVYDGLLAALMHRPDVGRRHLVVALTDAVDAGSAVSSFGVHAAATRSEGVLHLVMLGAANQSPPNASSYWYGTAEDDDGVDRLKDAAVLTGGAVHDRAFGNPDPVAAFADVFDDFRSSYVLRYTPSGVEAGGWHKISVTVPTAPRATIRARRGYYGSRSEVGSERPEV